MGQGMDDKIHKISELLNSPEAQESIQNLFSSLSREKSDPAEANPGSSELAAMDTYSSGVPVQLQAHETDWINHIQNMLGRMSNIQDSRINLLRSVHPFLNPTRRERCATCINILKVASLLRALTNNSGRLI